jgi:hypothetical protein
MDGNRRWFLNALVPVCVFAGGFLLHAQSQQSQTQLPQLPPDLRPQKGLPENPTLVPELSEANKKAILKEDQKELKKDVQRLFALAQELKSQADKMDSTSVLSVSFMQNAEDIEKLAKKIRNLARG